MASPSNKTFGSTGGEDLIITAFFLSNATPGETLGRLGNYCRASAAARSTPVLRIEAPVVVPATHRPPSVGVVHTSPQRRMIQ